MVPTISATDDAPGTSAADVFTVGTQRQAAYSSTSSSLSPRPQFQAGIYEKGCPVDPVAFCEHRFRHGIAIAQAGVGDVAWVLTDHDCTIAIYDRATGTLQCVEPRPRSAVVRMPDERRTDPQWFPASRGADSLTAAFEAACKDMSKMIEKFRRGEPDPRFARFDRFAACVSKRLAEIESEDIAEWADRIGRDLVDEPERP